MQSSHVLIKSMWLQILPNSSLRPDAYVFEKSSLELYATLKQNKITAYCPPKKYSNCPPSSLISGKKLVVLFRGISPG